MADCVDSLPDRWHSSDCRVCGADPSERALEHHTFVEHHWAGPYSIQAAYDLRPLIRKGLLEKLPDCNRYRLTQLGRRLILFTTKLMRSAISSARSSCWPTGT